MHVTKKDFFKTDHFKASRQKEPGIAQETFQEKTLQLLVTKSKRLGGYTQTGVLFSSKRYTQREDLTKRYMVSLKKALGRRLFLLGKT